MTTNPPEQTPDQGPAVPPPAPGYGAPAAPLPPLSDAEQRQWAMFAHLGGIIFGFIPALIIWLMHKARGRFVDEQSKEALNWWINIAAIQIVLWIVSIILIAATCSGRLFCTGGAFAWLPWLAWALGTVFAVMGGIAANKGEAYRYPFAIRLVK
jgi:hypothetical protein